MSRPPRSAAEARIKAKQAASRAARRRDALSKLRAIAAWVEADSRVPVVTVVEWTMVLEDLVEETRVKLETDLRDERRFNRIADDADASKNRADLLARVAES